jgi:hypothetical protein
VIESLIPSTFREPLDDDRTIASHSIFDNQLIVLDEKVDGQCATTIAEPKPADPVISYTRASDPPSAAGVCGLANLGNICYFNSVTRCLLHSAAFVGHFLVSGWERGLNPTNPIGAGLYGPCESGLVRPGALGAPVCSQAGDVSLCDSV